MKNVTPSKNIAGYGPRGKIITDNMVLNAISTIMRSALYQNTLDNKHKINRDCGYPDTLAPTDYEQLFEREGVADRVVRILPEESWKEDPEIIETEDLEQETPFEKSWNKLEMRHQLFDVMERVDVLSGIGRFGIILIGVNDGRALREPIAGVTDGRDADPEEPLKPNGKKYKLLYVRTFDESVTTILEYERNPMSPRYALPLYYQINFQKVANETQPILGQQKVHWSRVIHVVDNKTNNEVFGISRMQQVYNRLFDIRKIVGGSGEMFWRGGFPGINFKVDPSIRNMGANISIDKDSIRDEMNDYTSGMQRYLAMEGMSADPMNPQVADPTAHFEMNLKAIAISKGIPYRIFTGTEQAVLAGDADKIAFNGRIKRRQKKQVNARIVRPFVDRLILLGILEYPKQGEYIVKWPDLNTPSNAEKATIAGAKTTAIVAYAGSDAAQQLYPPLEFFTRIMDMTDDEALELVKAAEKQMDEKLQERLDNPPFDPVTGKELPMNPKTGEPLPIVQAPPPGPEPTRKPGKMPLRLKTGGKKA